MLSFVLYLSAVAHADFDICRGQPDGKFFPVMGDCSRYYSCVGGSPYEYQCPTPLLFNRKQNLCDYPENVKECDLQCPSTEGVTMEPSLTSCREFILCVGGKPYLQDCGPGYAFDSVTKVCRTQAEATCSVDACDGKPDGWFLPGRKCSEYYVCFENKGYVFNCAEGMEYDPWLERCALAGEAQCSVSQAKALFLAKRWPQRPPQTTEIACPTKRINFYASPTDPDYFFACLKGESHLIRCPIGQVFDEVKKRCVPLASKKLF